MYKRFDNEEKTYRFLLMRMSDNRRDSLVELLEYMTEIEHGTGEQFKDTPSYKPFMEDKWCIIYEWSQKVYRNFTDHKCHMIDAEMELLK